MSFDRLIESKRGQIVLINLYETLTAGLVEVSVLKPVLSGLSDSLGAMPSPYTQKRLLKALAAAILSDAPINQLAGREPADEDIVLVGIRPFDDLAPLLRKLRRQSDPEQSIRLDNAFMEDAPDEAMADIVEVVNAMSPDFEFLTIGWKFGVFWGTHIDEFRAVEAMHAGGGGSPISLAQRVRDLLGLVHYPPQDSDRPQHLFAFEARHPLGQIGQRCKARRPTTLDGFDNHRFRQHRPPGATALSGCGLTVDLKPGFAVGAPECVSTEIPLRYFNCRYLGRLTDGAGGTDAEFLRFLAPPATMDAMAATLQAATA